MTLRLVGPGEVVGADEGLEGVGGLMGWLAMGVGSVAFSWVGWAVCLVVGGEGWVWSFGNEIPRVVWVWLGVDGWMDGWTAQLCLVSCVGLFVSVSQLDIAWCRLGGT